LTRTWATEGADLLRAAGHDVATSPDEGLSGAPDHATVEACRQEDRCLITLDLDFSNPRVFRPSHYYGIVVLRLPPKAMAEDLLDALRLLIRGPGDAAIDSKPWVVQRGRTREYEEDRLSAP